MATYSQTDRRLNITTPLGPDILLITGFKGHEEISHLFDFRARLIADLNNEVRFEAIIGQGVTIEMNQVDGSKRYFNGIVKRFSQRERDENFVHFRAQIVPKFWLLTKKVRSRIFQHLTVPDILKQVLVGFDVSYDITGTYYPRDYCVQYRESDFNFAARLMEEEGIYYFFKHSDGNHQMLVSDNTGRHPAVPGQTTASYEEATGDVRAEMRVSAWEKIQEIRSGECTLWDYCFEVPTNHLEAKEKTIVSVPVGKVTHKLNLANDTLEIYDYPGRYSQRYDGIDPKGGNRPSDITHMFEDRTRTVRLRMEQEEVNSIRIVGRSDCGQFTAGHKFTLERHFDASADYVLTRVEHAAYDQFYRSDADTKDQFKYDNRFTCIPDALRYRPQRKTRAPVIPGIQTATVVGPPGEDIFVDKYGRVKVQFHWDREGKMNADSSCWLRVAQVWAGKGWGAFFWPRIGHEVVVAFEEGDPDQPLIVGSVYNAENMPWYNLPINKELGGIKSASEHGSFVKNFNAVVFCDKKGREHLALHSERNLTLNSESDKQIHSGRHKGERVAVANMLTTGKLFPSGGGSGGGNFDAGSPLQDPPPYGVLGLSSAVTYGANQQVACPLNHQLAVGSNYQMCLNPLGLLAGIPGAPEPQFLEGLFGGGIGGNMQYTVGASAQFTLGQSFELSVGPPKIESHAHYKEHVPTIVLCGILSAVQLAFVLAYGLMANAEQQNLESHYPNANLSDPMYAGSEQSGDSGRAKLSLAYQIVTDVMLAALITCECFLWKPEKDAKDDYKEIFGTPAPEANVDPSVDWIAVTKAGLSALLVSAMVLPSLEEPSN